MNKAGLAWNSQSPDGRKEEHSVIVIADKLYQEPYRALAIEGEGVEIHSLTKALDAIGNHHADMVILDCGHDAAKGLRLIGEIKKGYPNVPVIFITDVSCEETAIKAYKGGVRDYVRKPFNLGELQEKIESILKLKRDSRERRSPFSLQIAVERQPLNAALSSERPPGILRTINFISDNLSEKHSLKRLAAEANLSIYHFCRLFKMHTGMSPLEFVTLLRIERAKELFRKRGIAISSVAVELGFYDLGNFSRRFKKLTGMSPRQYRDSLH